MAEAWQSIEEAALTLGVSTRTLHRRIHRNEVETRLNNGRREVLVSVHDMQPEIAPAGHEEPTASASTEAVASGTEEPSLNRGSPAVLAMTEDRLRRTDLAVMAYQQVVTTAGMDARRSRVAARWAWGAVAALVAVSAGVGIWSTQRVTRANADVVYLEEQVGDLQEQVTQRTEQVEQFRSEALEARIEAATVRGEITAMRQTQTTSHAGTENADIGRAEQASQRVDAARPADYSRPTTRPSTLVDRLSTLLAD